MDAPAKSAVKAPALNMGEVWFKGRCTQVRKAGAKFLTLVVLPALDEYSSPSTVEVLSDTRFAAVGDDVSITCRASGFRRQYQQTDQETGEKRTVTTADNKFFFIEAK
jgi:hypothetical protein